MKRLLPTAALLALPVPAIAAPLATKLTVNAVESAFLLAPLGLTPLAPGPTERCFIREGSNTGATLQACYRANAAGAVTLVRGFIRDPDTVDRVAAAKTIFPLLVGVVLSGADGAKAKNWVRANAKAVVGEKSLKAGGVTLTLRNLDATTFELSLAR